MPYDGPSNQRSLVATGEERREMKKFPQDESMFGGDLLLHLEQGRT